MNKASDLVLSISVILFNGVFIFPLDGESQNQQVEQCPPPSEELTSEAEAIRESGKRVGTFRKSGVCYGLYRDQQGNIHRIRETPGKPGKKEPTICESIDDEHCGTKLRLAVDID